MSAQSPAPGRDRGHGLSFETHRTVELVSGAVLLLVPAGMAFTRDVRVDTTAGVACAVAGAIVLTLAMSADRSGRAAGGVRGHAAMDVAVSALLAVACVLAATRGETTLAVLAGAATALQLLLIAATRYTRPAGAPRPTTASGGD